MGTWCLGPAAREGPRASSSTCPPTAVRDAGLPPGPPAAPCGQCTAASPPPPPRPQIPLFPSQLHGSISYPHFPPRGNSLRGTCQRCCAPLASNALSNVLGNEPPPDLPGSIISRWLSNLHINNPLKGFFLPTPLHPLCTTVQESYNMFSATAWHHRVQTSTKHHHTPPREGEYPRASLSWKLPPLLGLGGGNTVRALPSRSCGLWERNTVVPT